MSTSKSDVAEVVNALRETYGDGGPASCNPDLERAILGACLIEIENYQAVAPLLADADFTEPTNRFVWGSLRESIAEGIPPDRTALVAYLKRKGKAGKIKVSELDQMVRVATARPLDVGSAGRLLHQHTVARQLMVLAGDIQSGASKGQSIEQIIGQAEKFLGQLRGEALGGKVMFTLEETVQNLPGGLEELLYPYHDKPAILTQFPRLNGLIHAFHHGELWLLGARPRVGKSLLAGQIASYAAQHEAVINVFTHEMKREAYFRRIIAQLACVRPSDMRTHDLSQSEYKRVQEAYQRYKNLPLLITDKAGRTPLSLAAALRRAKASAGGRPVLGVVDYLQLMLELGHGRSMAEAVPMLCRELKRIAIDLDVAILLIAALTKEAEKRDDKRPKLGDLMYGGDYDADGALLLDRPGAVIPKTSAKYTDDATLIVAKQRDGPTGDVPLVFDESYVRFDPKESKSDAIAAPPSRAPADDEAPF